MIPMILQAMNIERCCMQSNVFGWKDPYIVIVRTANRKHAQAELLWSLALSAILIIRQMMKYNPAKALDKLFVPLN